MALTTTEAEIKNQVQNYLNLLKKQSKLVWFRLNAGKIQTINKTWIHLGDEGNPDLLVITPKKAFGLELKKPKGKHREAQEQTQKNWEKIGLLYFFVHSFDEAKETIATYL